MKYFYSIISLILTIVILIFLIGCFNAYFYPMKYNEEIKIYAEKYQVEASLVASVACAESGFNENAISSKGAVGIMQLMPETAEWLCSKIGIDYDKEKLIDVNYNIEIGTYYLSYLINLFDNQKVALCAYNAGIGNVRNWLKNREYSKDGKTLNKIPFDETNNYVKKVNKNNYYYKNKYK